MGSKEGLCLWCGSWTEHRAPDGMADCYRPQCIETRKYTGAEIVGIGHKWIKDGRLYERDIEGNEVTPFFTQEDHYRKIVALLTAGDVAAEYEHNNETSMVVVRLVDGTKVFWANTDYFWKASVLSDTGTVTQLGSPPFVNWDSSPESVATAIAKFDYGDEPEPPEVQGEFREDIVDEPVVIPEGPEGEFIDLQLIDPETFEMMQNASLEDVAEHLDGKAKERAHSKWEDVKARRRAQDAIDKDEWVDFDPQAALAALDALEAVDLGQCSICKGMYPTPVELHHDEAECQAALESMDDKPASRTDPNNTEWTKGDLGIELPEQDPPLTQEELDGVKGSYERVGRDILGDAEWERQHPKENE